MMARFSSLMKDTRGATAVVLSLAVPVLVLAVGGGVDLTVAAAQQQRIASAVELGCNQAATEISYRSSLSNADPKANYSSVVNTIVNAQLAKTGVVGVTQVNSTASNVLTVTATANKVNAFGKILGFENVTLRVERKCAIAPAAPVGTVLFTENFEVNHNIAQESWGVLKNWNGWTTLSSQGGIEINGIKQLSGNEIRFGNFFAELDSHCYTSSCKTNSAMYREVSVTAGKAYELRYWYISRVRNAAYGSQEICVGRYPENKDNPNWKSTISNWSSNWPKVVDWATWEQQTNRIEVFFEKSTTSTTPATANMVDVCVHSDHWTERVIPLTPTTTGKYRIYFRAAGREDTYGGLIDYIRFCSGKCP